MSGSSGGSQQTSSNSSSTKPWNSKDIKFAQDEATDLYKTDNMFQGYDQSMVVPFAGQTTQAMGQIENTAGQNYAGFDLANQQAQNVLGGGGMTGGMAGALSGIQDVASGDNSITTGGQYNTLYGNASSPSSSQQNLQGLAQGDELAGDPNLMEALGRGADDIQRRVNMEASAMGRGGSVAHTSAMTDDLGDYYSGALSNNYNNARSRQMGANQMLDAQGNAQFGQQMGALQGQTQVQGANIANQVGAGQAAFDAGNSANAMAAQYAGMQPQMYENQYAGANKLMQVGALNEDLATRETNDDYRRTMEQQTQQQSQIEWLNAMMNGAGALGQTGQSSVQQPGTSKFVGALGGASAGAGIGSAFGPWGTGIGAGLGALGGAFF